MWRKEDDVLLARLENEEILARLFRYHAGSVADQVTLPARAAGLVESARALPGGEEASRDMAKLARLLGAPPMRVRPPELLHHLALYFDRVARCLSSVAPDAAANAWMRSLASWLALAEDPNYLGSITRSVLGPDAKKSTIAVDPVRELVEDLGRRAVQGSRDLSVDGRAALMALAWTSESVRLAGVVDGKAALRIAERARNAAFDAALASVGEGLDEANLRGELVQAGPAIIGKVVSIWQWSGYDAAVEHYAVERIATIAWEMYRARAWDALRLMLEPFWPLTESLAKRVERDPSQIAYAAPCAQMYVFFSDVERGSQRKRDLAERALVLCPTHRNGRLTLASLLCTDAQNVMKSVILFARKEQVATIEALIARAEALYPQAGELAETKAMLARLQKGKL